IRCSRPCARGSTPRPLASRPSPAMDDLGRFALVTFTSVLFIVDPIAAIPSYLVITQQETPTERRRTARRACLAMTVLLVLFAATGTMLFQAFGITLPAFRTAGGLILWFVAMDMLHGERRTQEGRDEVYEGQIKDDVAVTPLAIPMLAGPGAISTAIVVAGGARRAAPAQGGYVSGVPSRLTFFLVRLPGRALAGSP